MAKLENKLPDPSKDMEENVNYKESKKPKGAKKKVKHKVKKERQKAKEATKQSKKLSKKNDDQAKKIMELQYQLQIAQHDMENQRELAEEREKYKLAEHDRYFYKVLMGEMWKHCFDGPLTLPSGFIEAECEEIDKEDI